MRPILLCLVLCGLIGGIPVSAAETQLTTTGANSPAIVGNDNKVTFNDIDARALKRLNDLLDEKDLTIAQKIGEAEEWARKYRELDKQFTEARSQAAARGDDATLIKAAQDLLHEGKLEEAGKIYDQLLSHDESNIDRAAQDHFSRAQIYALQLRPLDALPHFAKAYQFRPDRFEYARLYADILLSQEENKEAKAVLDRLVPQVRELAAQNPSSYRPDLAFTLNRLMEFYYKEDRLGDAESASQEALSIYRDLAGQNPAYREDVANTLTNAGLIYMDTDRSGEAEATYKEALSIRRDLAAQNPAAYWRSVADTLVNLGVLYQDEDRFGEAESANKEALSIYRDLATQNPAYRGDVALALNNLGVLYGKMHRLGEAESAYKEALSIRLDLAAQNPAADRSFVAQTLYNLGTVYDDTHRFADAESAYKQAAAIFRDVAAQNPAYFKPKLVHTLRFLADLYRHTHRSAEAKIVEKEISKNASK